MKKNKSLKELNIFNNKIGYDAAKCFGDALAVNTTLTSIDFGHNRIRNKGLHAIAEGLSKNEQIHLRLLGFRFNFLNEEGVIDFLKLVSPKKCDELYIKNNSINEYGLFQLKSFYDNSKLT